MNTHGRRVTLLSDTEPGSAGRRAVCGLALALATGFGASSACAQSDAPEVGSQQMLLGRVDGTFAAVEPAGAGPDGLRIDGASEPIAWSRIVGLHGRSVRLAAESDALAGVARLRQARVLLVGGEELLGLVAAGDALGDTLRVVSPVLGLVQVPLDRLARIEFTARMAGVSSRQLTLPEGEEFAEALFRPARQGVDRTLGELRGFRDEAVLFAGARDGDEPRAVRYGELIAIAVAGGYEREEAASALLATRSGDRVGVEILDSGAGGALRVRLESGRELDLAWADIAALEPLGEGRTRLSALEPGSVEERSWFGDVGEPLWPMRRDRAATGGPLGAAGLGFASGLGVHARSVLSFEVPEGRTALVGGVALDDTVPGLGLRAAADVRIQVGGETVFEVAGLRAGRIVSFGRLPVRAGQEVRLVADFGPGLDLGDRVDWLVPTFF